MLKRCFFCACSLWCAVASATVETSDLPLDGLVLWLDAGDLDGDKVRDSIAGEVVVKEWRDKSGRGNHVVQANAMRAPRRVGSVLAGQPVVRFANSFLSREQLVGFRSGQQRFHLVVVMKAASGGKANPHLLDFPTRRENVSTTGKYTDKRKGFWFGYRAFAPGQFRMGVHVGDEGAVPEDAWNDRIHLIEAVYGGNQRWSIFLDGLLKGQGRFSGDNTFIGFDGGARLVVGQRAGSEDVHTGFRGDIGEVLLFDRPLKRKEQLSMERYFQAKYRLSDSIGKSSGPVPQFERDIKPLLVTYCRDCHGSDGPEGKLNVETLRSLVKGGTSGAAIVRGDANGSLLFHMIAANEMPPADHDKRMTLREKELVRQWLDAGAPASEQLSTTSAAETKGAGHWAFQALQPIQPPIVRNKEQVTNSIDRFVLARLEAKGLQLSPQAARSTLIRRAYLDLVGLIPTPDQHQRHLNSPDSRWYEQLLDELLSSPHFGERWGRRWLDQVGYSDTIPLDNDQSIVKPGPGKWKYRDYVVDSFNKDKPFSQFLTEQLAGDELLDWRKIPRYSKRDRDRLIATGFLRCSPDTTDENELNTLVVRHGILHRTAEMVSSHLLGLTAQCCKCHDHKFEPIPQRDYYRFVANFSPALDPDQWLQPAQRQVVALGTEELQQIQAQQTQLSQQRQKIVLTAEERLWQKKLARIPEEIRSDVRTALLKSANQRTDVQKYLAQRFAKLHEQWDKQVDGEITPAEKARIDQFKKAGNALDQRRTKSIIQAVYDVAEPSPVFVLRRGNYETPGAAVKPGLFSVLAHARSDTSKADNRSGSGRRLRLAKELVDWDSPAGGLVARVRVNRIWSKLLGQGIVETMDNFGRSGSAPTHPQLIDWLAAEFTRRDGRLKPFLRTIMLSSTYRQTSKTPSGERLNRAQAADGDNHLLWRQRLRRLESEVVRDSLLVASGRLREELGGAPSPLQNRADGKVIEPDVSKAISWRRSMYLLQRRNYHLSLLDAFDQPLLTTQCTRRDRSAVVSQSLAMLNDPFVRRQADLLASQVRHSVDDEVAIRRIFQATLARQPAPQELKLCRETLQKHLDSYAKLEPRKATHEALASICHMLMNTSEFLYVD